VEKKEFKELKVVKKSMEWMEKLEEGLKSL